MEILLIVYRLFCQEDETFLVQFWLLPISAVGSLVHHLGLRIHKEPSRCSPNEFPMPRLAADGLLEKQ